MASSRHPGKGGGGKGDEDTSRDWQCDCGQTNFARRRYVQEATESHLSPVVRLFAAQSMPEPFRM